MTTRTRPRRARDGTAAVDLASAGPLAGFTVAVTADRGRHELAALLRSQDARVVLAPAVRDVPPDAPPDAAALRRLGALIRDRLIDAVTFTSVPAVWGVLDSGGPVALDRLRTAVVAACVGPEAAEPLVDHGVPVLVPKLPRLGALVHVLAEELPRTAPTVKVAGAVVTLRGHAVLVNDALEPVAPGPMAVLRALAEARGEVRSRTALRQALPPGADGHTVDMAVARLRARLGSAFVEAVPRRGYRLALEAAMEGRA
jgi:uroporphyrinogen-III synthase